MARLARFSHFRAGEGGFTLFEEFCDLVLANADDATRGAREQLSRQDARERAWAFICSTPSFKPAPTSTSLIGEWQALERDQVKAGARAWRAYDAAVNVLRRCRMNPHALSISLSEWAREANYVDKSSALTAVHAAQDAELLFRLDRGEQSPAPGALCGIVSLRGKGETFDDAIRAGAFSDEINARFDARRERGLPPIMSTIKVPVAA
jgi:hypothetical protein